MRILRTILLMVVLAGLTGCGPSPTPYPTYTPYPTHTPHPTYTPQPTCLPPSSANPLWPGGPRSNVIPWQEADQHLGEVLAVEGVVVGTYNSGKAVFLNFAEDYRTTFKAVIFPDDWGKFPEPPEKLFLGRLVRVIGLIEEYEGAPEIIVEDAVQIEMAADTSCPPCPPCPTATSQQTAIASPTPAEAGVISWEDAAQHYGQVVTIEGPVVDTYNSGNAVFLNFAEDYRTTFKVVIFPDDWDKFPEPPEKLYQGKTIRVGKG